MTRSVPDFAPEAFAAVLSARRVAAFPNQTPPAPDGWKLYVGNDPGGDKVLVVYAGGDDRMDERETRGTVEHKAGIQVRIRAADQPTGKAKGLTVATLMDDLFNAPASFAGREFVVYNAHRTSPVMFLKQDEPGRQMVYVVNARLTLWEVL